MTHSNGPRPDYVVNSAYTARVLRIVEAAHNRGITPILLGEPGTGKTALLEGLAARYAVFEKVLAGSMDPTDVVGLPVRTQVGPDDWATEYAEPGWARRSRTAPSALVFFDELSGADQAVQQSLLTLIQSHQIPMGPHLPRSVRFVAAANPAEMATNGFHFTPAMSNRLLHLEWNPPADDWFLGMADGWGATLAQAESRMTGLVVAFLRQNGGLLHCRPEDIEAAGKAWPSRRSWHNLTLMLADVGLSDECARDEIIEGLVGAAAGAQFVRWLNGFVLPDPEIVLDEKGNNVDWARESGDKTFAILNSLLAFGMEARREDVVDVFMTAALRGPADIPAGLVPPMVKLYSKNGGGFPIRMMPVFKDVLRDAGLAD